MLMEEIFRDVYRNNIWGDPETVSGHGSGVARTAAFRDQFANLLTGYKILVGRWMRGL
jgi:hypothetical protein